MNKKLEKKLYDIDPTFFMDAIACETGEKNQMDTCMFWGCECGDGWFKPLQKFIHKVKFINKLAEKYNTKFICEQLKEKYGELRIYYKTIKIDTSIENKDKEIDYLIDMFEDAVKKAEDDCWNVCEWCGAEGGHKGENLITTSGWISRICKKCAKEKVEDEKIDQFPRITSFKDGYKFLSLFEPDGFKYNNVYYRSILQAFYSIKDPKNIDLYQEISAHDDSQKIIYILNKVANRFGVYYQDNEQDYKLLKDIVKAKFTHEWNEDIKQELLETKGKFLQNMGYHHNNILGHCLCKECEEKEHKDLYAKILMEVRDDLLNEKTN